MKFLTNESLGRGPCKMLSKILMKPYRVYIYIMLTLLTADTKDFPKTNLEYSNTKLLWFKLDSQCENLTSNFSQSMSRTLQYNFMGNLLRNFLGCTATLCYILTQLGSSLIDWISKVETFLKCLIMLFIHNAPINNLWTLLCIFIYSHEIHYSHVPS